jgi:hypothetical protein
LSSVQKELNFNDLSEHPFSNKIINSNQQPATSSKGKIKQPIPQYMNNNKYSNPPIFPFQNSLLDYRSNKIINSSFANKNSGVITICDSKAYRKDKSNEDIFDLKINLENILIAKDKRTIIMIRNVPNKYTLSNMVDEININFNGKYDYINLPFDPERRLNLGYAFINFVDPLHIVLFYDIYYNKKWNRYRSDKVYNKLNKIY